MDFAWKFVNFNAWINLCMEIFCMDFEYFETATLAQTRNFIKSPQFDKMNQFVFIRSIYKLEIIMINV